MEIGEQREGDLLVLRPVGRIDNLTSSSFQERLLVAARAGAADLVVDFTEVEYISSAGLRALMAASRAKPRDRRIAVAALNAVVQEIFAISRFSEVIPVFGTIEEAAAAWSAAILLQAPAKPIRVHFWGSRGSLPTPLRHDEVRAKIRSALLAARGRSLETPETIDTFIDRELPFSVRGTFGGNTSCVELITGGEEYVVCDLGTGVREFGRKILAEQGPAQKNCFNVFLSHVHWDHIMGFPFFAPAYIPGNLIRIYGGHKIIRQALRAQHSEPCFPVDFLSLPATIEFIELVPGRTYQIGGLSVTLLQQFHTGNSYAYRFSRGEKTVVYSTDCEHKYTVLDESYPFVHFYRDADVLVFDAMYSLADMVSVREDWGHSSNIVAVELAQMARVKRLVLFHHEPAYDDRMIESVFGETVRFEEISRDGHRVEVIAAYDGLEIPDLIGRRHGSFTTRPVRRPNGRRRSRSPSMKATISLAGEEAEFPRLIGFAESFAHNHALTEAERARLLIILEELFTNTVHYGYEGKAAMGRIEVALAVNAGRLTIEFSDDGRPFDPLDSSLPALDLSTAGRPIGGLGLHLVRSLVDHARYSRNGGRNRLVLVRKIAPPK